LCRDAPTHPLSLPIKVHLRLDGPFDLGLLQTPHWAIDPFCDWGSPASILAFFGHPCHVVYIFPPFRAMIGFSPTRYYSCRAQQRRACLHKPLPLGRDR